MKAHEAQPDRPEHHRRRRCSKGWFLAGRMLLAVGAAAVGLWVCTAFHFQLAPSWQAPAMVAAAIATLGVAALGWRRPRYGWLALALLLVATAVWWRFIVPSNDRDWAADVSRGVTGTVNGTDVVLHNVRRFDWRADDDFTPRWETRRYRLDQIRSVDLYSSVWGSPAIAHTLIGFSFDDGSQVVFSAEIRRERHEAFSEIGGFFKEFELAMIAADPDDIIRVRTDVRGEQVSRFRLRLTREQAQALFLSYLARANELAARPEFYQTITSNCTTVIFKLARLVDPRIPIDWRILFSGYLPDYLYELGIISTDVPLAETRRRAIIAPMKSSTRLQ